jgi:hypothetical protein
MTREIIERITSVSDRSSRVSYDRLDYSIIRESNISQRTSVSEGKLQTTDQSDRKILKEYMADLSIEDPN